MKTVWVVISALCGATAVYFVVREDFEKMFVVATVGAVAWFLSYRVGLRKKLDEDEANDVTDDVTEEDEEEV